MKTKIAFDLAALGVEKGDVLLVHSSFRSLGGGVTGEEVIEGLKEALGERGTLVFPALSWKNVNRENPAFDVRETSSCIGYLPELFRNYPGAVRSLHPTHSCAALGEKAVEITKLHHLDRTPVGENSPFRKIRDNNGKILFIGCSSRPNTSMHGVEELLEPDYLYGGHNKYTLTNYDGVSYNATYRIHGFAGVVQRYDRAEALLDSDEKSSGRVLGANCALMSSRALWEKGYDAIKAYPRFFVDISL